MSASSSRAAEQASGPSEREPLLGNGNEQRPVKKPFYRPRPLWLVPFVMLASITRGMTIPARVEIFTQLSCNAVRDRWNNTTTPLPDSLSLYSYHDSSPISIMEVPIPSPETPKEDDPRELPTRFCLTDPEAQAGAARLQTIVTTVMGIFSALTTGWWGRFGERHGRMGVLSAATLGMFLTDLTFILVSTPNSPFATHHHKFLVVAPLIEGLLGGWSTVQSAASAYVSDCTSDGSRAQIFSRFNGVFYFGLGLGPLLSAFLINHPLPYVLDPEGRGNVKSVFYAAIFLELLNFLLVAFVFPESLSKEQQHAAKAKHAESARSSQSKGFGFAQELFGPLTVFVPVVVTTPSGRKKRDWSMTYLGVALLGYLLVQGMYQYKYLYAVHIFEWSAQMLSYYVTISGVFRTLVLLFLLPYVIALFKPVTKPKATIAPDGSKIKIKPTASELKASISFDLKLSLVALFMEGLAWGLVTFAPTDGLHGQILFLILTNISSVGTGVVPGVQSLALCILQARSLIKTSEGEGDGEDIQNGSLFGALAVLQAAGQMIVGPLAFGIIFSSTVGVFDQAIFAISAICCIVSLFFLAFVRAPAQLVQPSTPPETEIERGRSRISKDLRGGAHSVITQPGFGAPPPNIIVGFSSESGPSRFEDPTPLTPVQFIVHYFWKLCGGAATVYGGAYYPR